MTAVPFFLGHLRFSAACHAAGYPSRVPHLADSGWLPYSCGERLAWGWGVSWYRCPDSPLGFLPCDGATPPSASYTLGFSLPWRVHQHVCFQSAGLLLGLSWWGLCYITWFSPVCHALPQGLQLAQPSQLQAPLGFFRSPGVCPSASLVAWVGLHPFPSFSGLLLLRLLAGVDGVLHPVSGCSSCGGVCLVCR